MPACTGLSHISHTRTCTLCVRMLLRLALMRLHRPAPHPHVRSATPRTHACLCLHRFVTRHADPVMATGWHMVLGGVLLLGLALRQDPDAITQVVEGLGPQVRARSGSRLGLVLWCWSGAEWQQVRDCPSQMGCAVAAGWALFSGSGGTCGVAAGWTLCSSGKPAYLDEAWQLWEVAWLDDACLFG